MRTDVNSLNWKGAGWMNVALPTVGGQDVRMMQVSAGLDGFATGVGSDGQVYMRTGVTEELPAGNAWTPLTDGTNGARFR